MRSADCCFLEIELMHLYDSTTISMFNSKFPKDRLTLIVEASIAVRPCMGFIPEHLLGLRSKNQ